LIDGQLPEPCRRGDSEPLQDARVRVITWSPHTTQIFQGLDISFFGVLKRLVQYPLPFDDDEGTAAFILKTDRMFKKTMIEANIGGPKVGG
jgi:hypothetical protein